MKGDTPTQLADTDTLTPDPMPDDPLLEAQIDNYSIRCKIGQGGFGAVYKARDRQLDRDVAVKFLRDSLDSAKLELFKKEARAIAALSKHAHIVTIHTWGTWKEHQYIILEYVESNAAKLLSASPTGLPIADALRIAAECAEGLAFAHRQGILHRDIKPSNILIEPITKEAKIADFGLVRFFRFTDETSSNTIAGTPSYMSPEQIRGEDLDGRSDVFSLGVTLYELLSGRKPFEGASTSETMELIRRGQKTPLQIHRPDLPKNVLELVDRAIQRKREHRFQSASDMADEIRKTLAVLERSGSTTPSTIHRRWSIPRALPIVLPVAAVAIALLLLNPISQLFHPGTGSDKSVSVVLAEATEDAERGDFQAATAKYNQILNVNPEDEQARYGLGYAMLQQGLISEAAGEFGRLQHEELKTEGVAAVAFEQEGANARPTLDAVRNKVTTAYPDVLIAVLDLTAGRNQEIVERLAEIANANFNFRWQRARGMQTLGQAYYRLGNLEESRRVFADLEKSETGAASVVARTYAQMAAQQLDENRKKEIRGRIQNLKEILSSSKEDGPQDDWTSRPVRLWILQPEVKNGRIAIESGLADCFPWLLSDKLAANTVRPVEVVDREYLLEILAEQEMSSQLSSGDGRVRLGRILGATILVSCKFDQLMGKECAYIKADNIETTAEIPVDRFPVDKSLNPDEWAARLAGELAEAVAKAFPLRGRLTVGPDGPQINIGKDEGVRESMKFRVAAEPNEARELPGRTATVERLMGDTEAGVTLEGLGPSDIPAGGLYVFEEDVDKKM